MRFVIFTDTGMRWHWELRNGAGATVARSATDFSFRSEVIDNIRAMRLGTPKAAAYDLLGNLIVETQGPAGKAGPS